MPDRRLAKLFLTCLQKTAKQIGVKTVGPCSNLPFESSRVSEARFFGELSTSERVSNLRVSREPGGHWPSALPVFCVVGGVLRACSGTTGPGNLGRESPILAKPAFFAPQARKTLSTLSWPTQELTRQSGGRSGSEKTKPLARRPRPRLGPPEFCDPMHRPRSHRRRHLPRVTVRRVA